LGNQIEFGWRQFFRMQQAKFSLSLRHSCFSICMASMKKEEARRTGWAKKHPNDARIMGGFLFFRYLQKERSDLLDFRAIGGKWQIVHGWLRDRLMSLAGRWMR
jgi:hypothetical protein